MINNEGLSIMGHQTSNLFIIECHVVADVIVAMFSDHYCHSNTGELALV